MPALEATPRLATPPADAMTSGVKIVDKDGAEITSATDGERVYFEVPEKAQNGSAEVTVQASTTVPVSFRPFRRSRRDII